MLTTSPLEGEGRLDLPVLVAFIEVGRIKDGGVEFGSEKRVRNKKKSENKKDT